MPRVTRRWYVQPVTAERALTEKQMRLRYDGTCRMCGVALPAGHEAVYERDTKTVRCIECPTSLAEPAPDVADGSARREYERRKNAREDRIRTNHPRLGGLVLTLSDDPQSTRAWERGAVGEERLAKWLENLPATVRVLHDRRIPGSRANIDHMVVAPSGVWVIDAKRYKGAPTLRVEGGIVRPRVESLRVGGRDKTKLVDGVQSQVERVTAAVEAMNVPVLGVLCFVEADWPLVGGAFTVRGVQVLWPRLLVKRISSTPGEIDVAATHARLAAAFPKNP